MDRAKLQRAEHNLRTVLKWFIDAFGIGALVGVVAALFHHGIEWATHFRLLHPEVLCALPLGGMMIVLLYKWSGMEQDRGTNLVLVAVREAEPMKLRTAPLIFLSTIITHLVGGSAGREGAALQLGGSIGAYLGKKMKLDDKDRRIMVMCGMSSAFSGLFGTPLTAAVFSIEVVNVGKMHYAALVPGLTAALVSFEITKLFGLHHSVGYEVHGIAEVSLLSMVQVAFMGLLCALVSILFCVSMNKATHLYAKYIKNPVLRAFIGGLLLLILTIVVGNQDYNGAGDATIRRMLAGEDIYEAFLLKILFTAVTLGAGFRGGEIVPALFTGCGLGTMLGPYFALPHSFSGALGMVAVFCGATNCPISSVFLAYELFGGENLILYAVCCATSYALSGYYGLYSEQNIVYSKVKTERVDLKAHH